VTDSHADPSAPQLQPTVAVLGTGTMGEAVVAGLLRSGRPPSTVVVTARRPERARELERRLGVRAVANAEAAGAEVVVLAVKPGDMERLVAEVAPALRPGSLVVSVAAGLPTAWFERRLPDGSAVVRVMPNTPVAVGEGMSLLCGGVAATADHLASVEELLHPLGRVARVPEHLFDAATALAGSGPAYHFLFTEALVEAGVLLGLPRALARDLAAQTAYGSALMLRDSELGATALREQVTSPGGTTIAALRRLESGGLRASVFDALEAARDRGRELGRAYE
jgi:pyrroline-5-carboxylate reductase